MKDFREKWQPLDYAKAACDTMMRKFRAEDLPPKGGFHYHQGVFLSGMYETYKLCRKEKYFQYMKDWVDSIIDENGEIHTFHPGELDDLQAGILLFPIFLRTGELRYKKALDTLMEVLRQYPRNKDGGFWHKESFPDQMWLDGLYMAGPVSAEYAYCFGATEYLETAVQQALLMREKTEDKKTGLWYHAWDCSGQAEWADQQTGLSPEFWGRSMGWVPVAVLDEIDFMPPQHEGREQLESLVRDLLTALCQYQSEEGRWYQVVDKGGYPGNWLENSCSCLYVAAICKAIREGILEASFFVKAKKGYQAVIRSLRFEGEDIQIGNVCIGTGVGDYAHYCNRPISINDLHGVGAFLLMCTQMQKMDGQQDR